MPFDFDLIKANNPIAEVIGRQVTLKKSGQEFVALCPFHGEKTPSFTVVPAKGFFKCFGCGEQGDVIDFTRRMHSVDLHRACEMLGAQDQHPFEHREPPPAPEEADIYAGLVPQPFTDDLPLAGQPLRCWNPKTGKWPIYKPSGVYPYYTAQRDLVGLVIRVELPDAGKFTPQLRYVATPDGELTWSHMPFDRPRPLYRLDRLGETGPVLMVEGEKCADAAAAALDCAVTSWPGGANGIAHVDWTPLAGRSVIIWGDADEEGENSVRGHTARDGRFVSGIVDRLRRAGAAAVSVIPWDRTRPKGWDVADAINDGWNRGALIQFIGTAEQLRDPDNGPPEPDPDDPGPQPENEPEYTGRRSRRQASGAIQWSDPVDFLADDSMGTPDLLPEHLPAALWPFVSDTAARMGVDPTSVALGCLVSCASVISDEWRIQPRRFDYTWTEQARLWVAILGDPSTIKSPIVSACTRPIDKLDMEARKRHGDDMRAYKIALAAHKKALKDGEPTEEPREPRLDRYMVEGATVEALSEVLRDDDGAKQRAPAGKVLSRHDEMSEFFANLDRYKAGGGGGGDRGSYLRLYNGGRYSIDRIGRGSFAVPNWSACFFGGCQPGPIQRIAREAADDGLLQRFMYAVPSRQDEGQDRAPDQSAAQRYNDLFPALVAMHPGPEVGSDRIRPITLHTDGHVHREEVNAIARAMMSMPDTSKRLQAAFGKWPGLFARLVLTFHLIDAAHERAAGATHPIEKVVPAATVERVANLMLDIVLPHLLRAEAIMFSTNQTTHARWVAGFILSQKFERVTTRDITRAYGALRSPEATQEMMSVMASLVAVGWLEPEESPNAAKPTHAWKVNPAVHTTFAARAEKERAAHQKAKEVAATDIRTLLRKRKNKEGRP